MISKNRTQKTIIEVTNECNVKPIHIFATWKTMNPFLVEAVLLSLFFVFGWGVGKLFFLMIRLLKFLFIALEIC